MKKYLLSVIAGLSIVMSGCGTLPDLGTLPALDGSEQTSFSLAQINENFRQQLPVVRKGSFGTVKIVRVSLQPGLEGKNLEVLTKFILTSFEIPEGIEGLVSYRGTLLYDPVTRKLYLSELQPNRLTFGNPSLEEYVSPAARKGIAEVIASSLKGMPVQTMSNGFRAKGIKKVQVVRDQLKVEFN
jgi:hypothetical protein